MASQGAQQSIDGTDRGVINFLREQIQLAKQELDHHFQSYHRMLYEQEQALVSELDGILVAANDLYEKRRELKQTEGDLEERMKSNELYAVKGKILEDMSVKVSDLDRRVSFCEREVVELEWRDSQMEAAIQESCVVLKRVDNITPYKYARVPLICVGTLGSGVDQLCKPRSVAVDPENEDIYVADKDHHRIVLYNRNREFVKTISIEGMKWPYAVVIVSDFCYVSSSRSKGLILKLNKRTGKIAGFLDPGQNMFALTFDSETGMLFACPVYYKSVWQIQLDNLEMSSELTLQTPYFLQNVTEIYDIKTLKDELYILFCNSPYPLQSFSRDGNLLRTIISQDMVSKIQYFCIDFHNNLIISDSQADKVIVTSLKGEVLAILDTYSTDEDEPANLYDPRGVALMRNGHIVVVCGGKRRDSQDLF